MRRTRSFIFVIYTFPTQFEDLDGVAPGKTMRLFALQVVKQVGAGTTNRSSCLYSIQICLPAAVPPCGLRWMKQSQGRRYETCTNAVSGTDRQCTQ
jgi:hypothetical protein